MLWQDWASEHSRQGVLFPTKKRTSTRKTRRRLPAALKRVVVDKRYPAQIGPLNPRISQGLLAKVSAALPRLPSESQKQFCFTLARQGR